MKALSLKQPWAELILLGKKTIETRKWNTFFRGAFLIHASKTVDKKACSEFNIDPKGLVTGAIVGKARLVSVKKYSSKKDFEKDKDKHLAGEFYANPVYGFLLRDVKRVKQEPIKGKLGFFKVK